MRFELKRFLYVFAVVCLSFNWISPAETAAITVVNGHPRIFITPSKIATLNARAAGTHRDTYTALKNWCDTNWTNGTNQRTVLEIGGRAYDAGVLRFALIYVIGEVTGFDYTSRTSNDYGDKTVNIVLDMVSLNQTSKVKYVAIAYDWVNARMSTAQKTTVVNWFRSIPYNGDAPSISADAAWGYHAVTEPNSFWAGLAFANDGINDSLAQTYADYIESYYLDQLKATAHMAGEDGGHGGGFGYSKYTLGPYYKQADCLYALVTATDLTIDDTFNTYTYMKGYPIWFFYGFQPGPVSAGGYATSVATFTKWEDTASGGFWNLSSNDYGWAEVVRIIAHVYKEDGDLATAQLLTWVLNTKIGQPSQDSTWDMIFNDRITTAVSPSDLDTPTCKAFGWNEKAGTIDSYMTKTKAGLGHVYMKSSWDNGDDQTHACFKAPPFYYYGHQHFDALAFSVHKGEPLALPNAGKYFYWYEGNAPDDPIKAGFPHHHYYFRRGLNANTLLIMDPSEVNTVAESGYSWSFRDGAQRGNKAYNTWENVVTGSLSDNGGLIRHEDTSQYTYSSADATIAYNSTIEGVDYVVPGSSPKVSLVQRDFVYLKSDNKAGDRDYFVVFDRIDSTDPTFKKVFLLHTIGEPILNGTESQIYGDTAGGLWESTNTDTYSISNTTAKLFMKSLMPGNRKVYKMGGETTTTTNQAINDTDGIVTGGPKIDIPVASATAFPDKPVVIIDNEAFMCEGKTSTTLTDCIRGQRYWSGNVPQSHSSGAVIEQRYEHMIRETDTGNWIAYPHDFGLAHTTDNIVADSDEYGRWALRIETVDDETHSNFLHVLHPTVNMSETSMVSTELLNDIINTNMAGCQIDDPHNRWVVLFSKTKNLENSLTYLASYSGNGKHLITGLEYGVYDIYKDGTKIFSKQTSNQNTLYFETNEGGNFQVTKSGVSPNDYPSASITANPTSGSAPLTVSFTGSGTDSDGTIVKYFWDFGDGQTATIQNPFHTYDTPDNYTPILTVTDNDGAIGTATVDISVSAGTIEENNPPTASMSANPPIGNAPLTVNFTGSATDTDGTVVAYAWDFGDGANSNEQNPSHTYNSAGSYSVTLTVTDDDGATAGSAVGIISSGSDGTGNNPPTASATANPIGGEPPLSVNFTGTGTDTDGTIVSYLWNFGDGSISNQQSPSHIYDKPGYYTVSLTVTDNAGAQGNASLNIPISSFSNFPYVINDFTFYPTPNTPRPAKGATFKDPYFHTDITRITDAPTEVPGSLNLAQPGYPKHNIENANGTRLVIQSMRGTQHHIYDANPPYSKLKDVPSTVLNAGADSHPRWDNTDPNILFTTKGPVLYQWNVETEQVAVVHNFDNDFPGETITYIGMGEEGDASDDRRYWAFYTRSSGVSHQTHILVYDKQKNTIISQMDWNDGTFIIGQSSYNEGVWMRSRDTGNPLDFNFVGMSPSGDWVVTGAPPSWIYPRDFSSTRWIGTPGHVDPAIDDEGDEVLVFGVEYTTGGVYQGWWLAMVDIATASGNGSYHPLAPIGRLYASAPAHNYCVGNSHDKPGWALVTIYAPTASEKPAPTLWHEHSVMMIELTDRIANPDNNNHSTVWRLAHTHSVVERYSDFIFGKTNKRGTKVWFGSGWGGSVNDGQSDVYQIDLPPNWYQDLKGNLFPAASISANPVSGTAPLTVSFSGTGIDNDGTVVSYAWNFGDGTTSDQQNPSHTYNNAGQYTVVLTITDNSEAIGKASINVTVTQSLNGSNPPAAYLSATPTNGRAPVTVSFSGSGTDTDGTIVSYAWNFGDGSTSNDQNPSHTYDSPGTYTATLTVTDSEGTMGQTSIIITVAGNQPPPSPENLKIQKIVPGGG